MAGIKGRSGTGLKSKEHKDKIRATLKRKGIRPPSRKGAKLTMEHKIALIKGWKKWRKKNE